MVNPIRRTQEKLGYRINFFSHHKASGLPNNCQEGGYAYVEGHLCFFFLFQISSQENCLPSEYQELLPQPIRENWVTELIAFRTTKHKDFQITARRICIFKGAFVFFFSFQMSFKEDIVLYVYMFYQDIHEPPRDHYRIKGYVQVLHEIWQKISTQNQLAPLLPELPPTTELDDMT
ncbi:uncharacterized protein LOC113373580 [Ctenocephalides felis]|uniref:uncharacterized protein LOC113373580 n=1 Tax=Ctenocephalides felis TaxID=7515 RepID=UPI000E6E2755|nr:uncharacterized protein LOC113373580 [Ctenocephalides felis]